MYPVVIFSRRCKIILKDGHYSIPEIDEDLKRILSAMENVTKQYVLIKLKEILRIYSVARKQNKKAILDLHTLLMFNKTTPVPIRWLYLIQ